MHDNCLFDGEKWWILFTFYLQYNDNFFFFLQKFIDTFHVQQYLTLLSKHMHVYIYIYIDTEEDKWELASTL